MTASRSPKRNACLLFTAAALFIAASASASGYNLGWNDCPGGPSYAELKTFACDTNTGIHTLIVSYVAPANVLAVSAHEIVIDMATRQNPLASWWSLRSASPQGCRPGSLTQSPDFTAGPFACFDYWQGGAAAGVSMDAPVGNRARIKALAALPAGSPLITSVPEGTHVYSIKININSAKTVGLGACAGCSDEACIALSSIRLNQPVGPPANGASIFLSPATAWHVRWQGWSPPEPHFQCPSIVPARTRTWGSIKALYR